MADQPEIQGSALAGFTPTYVKTTSHPTGRPPSATIYLHGLLCLCFDSAISCTAAVVEAKNHLQTFGVWDKKTCLPVDLTALGDFEELKIDVSGTGVNPVNVYAGVPYSTEKGSTFPAEGRWSYVNHCLDLCRAHGKTILPETGKLKKRFHIGNGLFSVCKLTEVAFELRNPADPTPSFNDKIGIVLAVDLFLNNMDQIKFKVTKGGTGEKTIVWKTGDAYEIKIDNSCSSKTGACKFDPRSMDETKRNDFHLYNSALKVPAKLQLWSSDPDRGSDLFPKIGHCPFTGPFSDRAPCMPAGLGMTTPGNL